MGVVVRNGESEEKQKKKREEEEEQVRMGRMVESISGRVEGELGISEACNALLLLH